MSERRRTRRWLIGAAGAVVVVLFAALAVTLAVRPAHPHTAAGKVGWVLFGLGAALVLVNVHVAYVRPFLHRIARRGRRSELSFVSGIPVFGSLFVAVGLVLAPPSGWLSLVATLFVALDPLGPVALAIVMADHLDWVAQQRLR